MIEALTFWWTNSNLPAIWKSDKIKQGFIRMSMPGIYDCIIKRHPTLDPSIIVPQDQQSGPSGHQPPKPNKYVSLGSIALKLLSVEYDFLRALSYLVETSEHLYGLSSMTNLPDETYVFIRKEHVHFGLSLEEITSRIAFHILSIWYMGVRNRPNVIPTNMFQNLELEDDCLEVIDKFPSVVEKLKSKSDKVEPNKIKMRTKSLGKGKNSKVNSNTTASQSNCSSIQPIHSIGENGERFYDTNPMLHDMPKYVTTCTGIRIGNGSIVPAFFVIPILFMACGHTFEIFTIVAEIDDDMDLVFGFKNMVETEGLLNTRTGAFDFIGRSIPIFPQNDLDVKPGEKAYVKIKAPFCDKLSGMICAKFFSRNVVNTLRIKIQDDQGIVQYINHQDEMVNLRKEKAVGILDLRSVGYFKVGYQKMVNMAESSKVFKMYHYQQIKCGTETEIDQYMRVTGKYKIKGSMNQINEEENVERYKKYDPYPWLTKDDPRRFQSDEEILCEKIDLSDSALSRKEKSRLMKMLIKYRDAFSLRDEIGECPNLKADIKVIDESPFFVRPFPISEKDKPFMDEQMERLVSLGILSKNSTNHTSPVMLITRKMTKDKRPVVDFRLLNTRILRRNTSIPLMSDVLSILGNSECEVVSCVDIKDAYHSLRLTEKSKEYCGILPYFGSPIYRYEVLPMGIAFGYAHTTLVLIAGSGAIIADIIAAVKLTASAGGGTVCIASIDTKAFILKCFARSTSIITISTVVIAVHVITRILLSHLGIIFCIG